MKRKHGLAFMAFVLVAVLIAGSGCKPDKKPKFGIIIGKVAGSSTIGTGGGSLNITDPSSSLFGAGVDIPAGTFSEDTKVEISEYLQDIAPPPGMQRASKIIKVNSSTPPQTPFTIILPYKDEDNDGLEDDTRCPEVLLMPYRYDSGTGWVAITKVSQDLTANRVTASSDRMGKFALFGPIIDPTVQPQLATNPSPADGAVDIDFDVTLGWDFPGNTTGFDLYFGTDKTAVETATTGSSEFIGSIATNFQALPTLPWFTTYYWRVDSVNDAGKAKMATAWSFRTRLPDPPAAVVDPNPPDGTQDASLTQTLSWTPANGADSYNVYQGISQAAVAAADTGSPEFQGNVTALTYTQPGTLVQDTSYYWRIDSVNAGGVTPSAVWSFRTIQQLPDAVSNPDPPDGATNQLFDVTLSWDNDALAVNFDVYFGNDYNTVFNENTSNLGGAYVGNQVETTYVVSGLNDDQTYYWRIDTVNGFGSTKGAVWQFETGQLPDMATLIDPPDAGGDEELDQTLSWANALGATSYDVYLGNSFTAVDIATTASTGIYRNEVFTNSWATPTLAEDTSYYWRIDSRNAFGTVKGPVWSFRTGLLPGLADTPSPADGAVDQTVSLTLGWNAVNATLAHVYLGNSQALVTSGDPSVYLGNTAGTTMPSGFLDPVVSYYWRVDTENAVGRVTGNVWDFSTAAYPPAVFISGPGNNTVVTTPSQDLSWTCGGVITDSFDVYLGTDYNTVFNENTSNLGGSFMGNQVGASYVNGALLPDTTYYWRVDPRNFVGVTTGIVYMFTTILLPPQAVNPGPVHQETDINTLTPTLTWDCGGTVTTQFRVYFGDNQTDVASGNVSVYQGIRVPDDFTPGTLAASTSYYWRIDAENDFDNTVGAVWEFRVTDPPPAATIDSPTDAATDIATATPTLKWDCGGTITDSFELYFSATKSDVDTLQAGALAYSGTGNSWVVSPALSAATTYYWRVNAMNGVDNDSGTTWSFGTFALPPAAITPSPADGNSWVMTTTPTLSWNCGGEITDEFHVYFDCDSGLVSSADPSTYVTTISTLSSGAPWTLTSGQTYYWRIDASNNFGNTSSGVWSFRVTPLPPTATAPSPADNNSWVPTTTPTLSWSCGGEITDSFEVYFGTELNCVSDATTVNGYSEYIGSQAPDTYAPGILIPGASYYWRIDTVNAMGTTDGSVWSFRIAPPAPAPAGFSPDNEVWGVAASPTLSWDCGGMLTDNFNVYFGADRDCVSDATPSNGYSEFIANQAGDTYGPLGPLLNSTTYWWRIEACNPIGNTSGGLYWFRTLGPPLLSSNPTPANASTGITVTPTLDWENSDPTVTDFGVYFGDNFSEVLGDGSDNTSGTYRGTTGGAMSWNPPGTLAFDTTYYWRIDPMNGYGNSTGGVWWFRTYAPVTVTISSIDPASGLCAGLTFVNIYGSDFDGTCEFFIGNAAVYGVTLQNSIWITCYTPAGAVGFANVSVDKGPGLANDTLIDAYEYLAFPGAIKVNTNQAVTWANQEEPALIVDSNNAALVFFTDNRRSAMDSRFSGEIYWSIGSAWFLNAPMYSYNNSASPPNREEPQVIRGSSQYLFMTWFEYGSGNESIYFDTTNTVNWDTAPLPLKVCDINDLFGEWMEDSDIVYVAGPDELSIFILSGNSDDISQITRYFSVDSGLNWSFGDNVTGANEPIWDFDAAANSLDGICVVYANVTNLVSDNVQIYCKYFDGSTWTGPYRVDNDVTDAPKGFPHVLAGSDNTLYVAWLDNRGGDLDIYFSKSFDNGTTWLATEVLVDGNASDTWDFDFIMDSFDNMWIGMVDYRNASAVRNTWITRSSDWGNTWSSPVQADPGTSDVESLTMACLPDGTTVYAAGRVDNDIYVLTSVDGGSTWGAPTRATHELDSVSAGALEDSVRVARHDGLGNMCALWLTGQPAGVFSPQIRFGYSDDDGTNWISDNAAINDILFLPPEDAEDLRGDPVMVAAPTLLANVGSTLAFFAAWSDGRNSSSDWDQTGSIYFNWANASGGWQEYPNICVTDGPGTLFETDPFLAMDNAGAMLCIWTEYDGTSEQSNPVNIRVARSADGGATWSSYAYVNTAAPGNWRRNPRVIFDNANGLWYAVWQDSRNGGGDKWDWDVYCRVSSNGGATWVNESQVNTVASSYTWQPIPVIDPTNGRLYVFWREGGIAYQFSDDGCQTWNGSDTWVDSSGWPASGGARSYDVTFTPEGVAQIVIDHVTGSPEITDWRVLLQRGLPGSGDWGPPITVSLQASTTLKLAGAVAVKPSTSEVIVVWPDGRDNAAFTRSTEVFSTKGR